MTVRTWITISVVAMLALGIAAGVRFLSQPGPPAILARAGAERLEGRLEAWCWPKRGGEVRCGREDDEAPRAERIPRTGSIRVIVAFPAQPAEGALVIERSGQVVERSGWTDELEYRLTPGRYRLVANARYGDGAYVRYSFPFRVARLS